MYLRNQGRKERGTFIHPEIGYNFRMTDIQCAIGLTQLKKLDEIKNRKMSIKKMYSELLQDVPEVVFFSPEKDAEWIPFRVGILCERAHELMNFMQAKEIEPRTFFYPLHRQPCYSSLLNGQKYMLDEHFPNAVFGYENGVCLPTFPALTTDQIRYTCDTIKKFYAKK